MRSGPPAGCGWVSVSLRVCGPTALSCRSMRDLNGGPHYLACRLVCHLAPPRRVSYRREISTHQMGAAVHGRNRAQMRPSGEIARMAHPTQPMATDRVPGQYRTRISLHPSYSGYIGGSTEFHGLQEAKIGHFGGFRRSGNRFEMRAKNNAT